MTSMSNRILQYSVLFADACCSCLGMFHYGVMVENAILIFLYGVGAFLQSLYAALYLLVVKPKVLQLIDMHYCDYHF